MKKYSLTSHRSSCLLDLQAILQLDPGHREATELLPSAGGKMPTGIGNVSQAALHSLMQASPDGNAEFQF